MLNLSELNNTLFFKIIKFFEIKFPSFAVTLIVSFLLFNVNIGFKISLFDLVPWELLKKYIEPLAYGYIREFQAKSNLTQDIPIDITSL